MENKVLQYDSWIKFAEDNYLLITPSEFSKLEPTHVYEVIQVDYIKFLFSKYSDKYGLKPNKQYSPKEILTKFTDKIMPAGRYSSESGPVLQPDGKVKIDRVEYYDIAIKLFDSDKPPFGSTLYKTNTSKYLASGSGDGYSRYMFVEDLGEMPDFYF